MISNHIIDTGLAPGYHDKDTLLLHTTMSILVQYVENDVGGITALDKWTEHLDSFSNINFVKQRQQQVEIAAIYRWWTEQRAEDWRKLSRDFSEESFAYETTLFNKDSEMIKRLVDIRIALWS